MMRVIVLNKFYVYVYLAVVLIGIVSCSPSDTGYVQSKINDVVICDLEIADIKSILGVNRIDTGLSAADFESSIPFDLRVWKRTDINISRCSSKTIFHADKAMRIYVPKEKWANGFSFTYDLYFDENNKLFIIEARHLFIDSKWP